MRKNIWQLLSVIVIVLGGLLPPAQVLAQSPEGINFNSPWICQSTGSDRYFLPRYHDRGDGQGRSIPNSSNSLFLQARGIFTDPRQSYYIAQLVYDLNRPEQQFTSSWTPRLRDWDVMIRVQREIRPISKNGEIVGILIVGDADRSPPYALTNGCARPQYQLHGTSPCCQRVKSAPKTPK